VKKVGLAIGVMRCFTLKLNLIGQYVLIVKLKEVILTAEVNYLLLK
jgi:hypothetical protein